jgi:hypothetical protein
MSETPEPDAPQTPAPDSDQVAAAEMKAEELGVAAFAGEDQPTTEPDDGNDLRGYHFKKLLGEVSTWVIIAVLVVIAGVAAGIYFKSPPGGGGAAALVFVISLIGVFAIADSRAEDAFFVVYAKKNGLTLGGRGFLPPATPLLRKGDDRYAERSLTGPMADGIEGTLALYTYEEESYDSKGNKQTSYYRYTVGLIEIPECADFRGDKERVKFESEELDNRYEVFVNEKQDQNWLRQLFAPTFIVWLLQETPDKFAFELAGGTLCCYIHNHREKSIDLDRMREATAKVATRLREEALE